MENCQKYLRAKLFLQKNQKQKMQDLCFALPIGLVGWKIRKFHILVIDEAAYLKKCESLIPLATSGIKHVVLVGDDKQLQSVVKSTVCLRYNL